MEHVTLFASVIITSFFNGYRAIWSTACQIYDCLQGMLNVVISQSGRNRSVLTKEPQKRKTFMDLPPEIRMQIWKEALPGPRVIVITLDEFERPMSVAKIPTLLHTCHESRLVAQKEYALTINLGASYIEQTSPPGIYISFARDTVYFGPYFRMLVNDNPYMINNENHTSVHQVGTREGAKWRGDPEIERRVVGKPGFEALESVALIDSHISGGIRGNIKSLGEGLEKIPRLREVVLVAWKSIYVGHDPVLERVDVDSAEQQVPPVLLMHVRDLWDELRERWVRLGRVDEHKGIFPTVCLGRLVKRDE